MERNCDALALLLWQRAFPDADHELCVRELYEGRLAKHLRVLPHLSELETAFDPNYTYKRAETVLNLLG